ncbi:(2Fe-2S)-binding protein [Methylomagnum ishizawai]|uniref:Bacterioferritin-associated ferredoxin n=1 Tax=Methylomagnum ishizawai TaxID=1760988 RepID=A0A1Y6D042_9GAMM|nr:(2Fe-2S)-binding protein [Methylomagnum ishizawai]BBL74763.1 (2Fe-2S)-binding protein [Methylomagnum ishizawai]SMF96007.1 bacterioferritin-associated ferredoxin [Methylomagnum ishizawai]
MYICICKNVTDGQIRNAVRDGRVRNMRGLRQELGACDQCGKCAMDACRVLRDSLQEKQHLTGNEPLAATG